MPTSSSFFNKANQTKTSLTLSKPTKKVVNVGGSGDCAFRAAAVAMLDNILFKPRVNQELAKYLLSLHAQYFQQPSLSTRLQTSTEQITKMEQMVGRTKFVSELAFCLRQAAVDKICSNPVKYCGAFSDKREGTGPAEMRKTTTPVDETALAALAEVVNIPVKVEYVAKGQEIPLCRNYPPSTVEKMGSTIAIQLQNEHYMPIVNQPKLFESLRPIAVTPKQQEPRKDPELDEILAKIEKEDQRIYNEYEETMHRLGTMLIAGEITHDDLLSIYVQGMQHSDYLQGRIKYVGIEHGTQHFFEAIENKRKGVNPIHLPQESYKMQITDELVRAIARAISINQLDSALLYAEKAQSSFSFK